MPKQAIIQSSIEAVEFIDTPIPIPKDAEVVIQVAVTGMNPKDWKYPTWKNWAHNSGDDIAGIVHSVGKNVFEFKPGDRVAALHEATKENGSFSEYAVAPDWTTIHLPDNVSFEEAATIPTAALTAVVALYIDMKLPAPYEGDNGGSTKENKKTPLVIYGVTSAVGAFAAKFARLSGLAPIIGIAGRAGNFASTLVDYVVDYRKGEDSVVSEIEMILTNESLGSRAPYVFDAISEGGTLETTLRFLDPNGGIVSTVLPPALFANNPKNFRYPEGVTAKNSACPRVHWDLQDFGFLWSRYLGRLLRDGRLKAHPYEVVPDGLNGVLTGLKSLKNGKASAVKYVCRVNETGDVAVNSGYSLQPEHLAQSSHPFRNFPFPA